MFFFFFSSRRRHTRCSRDWSSDVCSSDLFRSVLTPPVSFASTRSIKISFHLKTCGSCFPADSAPYVLSTYCSQRLSREILNSPAPPRRTSSRHRQPRSLPHWQSGRPRPSRGPPERPHRGNGGLSARRSRGTSFPRAHAAYSLDVSCSRPRLHFFQLRRALHAERRQRARRSSRGDSHPCARTSRRHRTHATPPQNHSASRPHAR